MIHSPTPLIGFAAWSGTGKTTLLSQLIPRLRQLGIRCAAIKHTHHQVDFDQPGKDSHTLRHAGADQILVASARRTMLIREEPAPHTEPNLQQLLPRLDHETLDLILVEGFKHEPIPRIELWRPELEQPLLYPEDPRIIAIALPQSAALDVPLPRLDLDTPDTIVQFITDQIIRR